MVASSPAAAVYGLDKITDAEELSAVPAGVWLLHWVSGRPHLLHWYDGGYPGASPELWDPCDHDEFGWDSTPAEFPLWVVGTDEVSS